MLSLEDILTQKKEIRARLVLNMGLILPLLQEISEKLPYKLSGDHVFTLPFHKCFLKESPFLPEMMCLIIEEYLRDTQAQRGYSVHAKIMLKTDSFFTITVTIP